MFNQQQSAGSQGLALCFFVLEKPRKATYPEELWICILGAATPDTAVSGYGNGHYASSTRFVFPL